MSSSYRVKLNLSPAQARLLATLLSQRAVIVGGWHQRQQEALWRVEEHLERAIATAYGVTPQSETPAVASVPVEPSKPDQRATAGDQEECEPPARNSQSSSESADVGVSRG